VGGLIREGTRRFRKARLAFGHGTICARDEAVWLVSHALRRTSDQALSTQSRPVPPVAARRILRLFHKRVKERTPAAYLTHEAWLSGLRFYVDERVIVPRSHIAGLLEDKLEPWITPARCVRTVLDLCTGSGCLAILLARAYPRARIDAADISRPALEVAKRNVDAFRLGRRIRLVHSNLFSNLREKKYDVIVCNPPYVTSASMLRLPAEYRHEPALALAGGRDGLGVVRRILTEAGAHLNPRGVLVVEVGRGRSRLERAFRNIPFVWPDIDAGGTVFVLEREVLIRQRRDDSSREAKSSRTRAGLNSRS